MVDRQDYIRIFNASPTPTSIVSADDPKFTFVEVNEAYTKMTQTLEKEILGKSLFEVFPENPEETKPSGVERLRNSFRKVIAEKQRDKMEAIRYDIKLSDGKFNQIYWEVINTPVFDNDGEVEFIINSATNITEQVLSERANRLMLNNTEDSFILINKDLIIQSFNDLFAQNYQEILGVEVKKGDSILDYAQPERRDTVKEIYEQVFKGETIEGELPVETQDGNTRFFNIRYKPARDENGIIIGSFISLLENTEEHLAKLELQKSEAYFRALVENGNDVLFILSPEAKPTYISPSIQNVLGYTQEEAYDIDLMGIVHPYDISIITSELEKCIKKPGETIEVTPARMKHKNGQYRWMEGTITNMLHDPSINGIVDNFRDITERIEYQEKLEVQRRKMKRILDQSADIICTIKDNVFTSINAASMRILGYKPEELLGENFFDFIFEEDHKKTFSAAKQVIKGELTNFQNRYLHRDGHKVPMIWSARWDEKEEQIYAIGRDATEIEAIEKEREFERLNKEALINSTEDIVWSIDTELKIITANQSFLDGVKDQVGLDLKPGDHALKGVDESLEYRKTWESYYLRALNGESFRIETHEPTDESDINYWYETSFNPIYRDGKITGVACFARDISETKQAEIQLRKAEEKFRNVVEHSTNMFYQHDINGVLDYVSPQSETFLGYSPEHAKSNWTDFITDHPINKEGEKLTQKAIETGEIQDPYELQLITKDNRIIWVEVHEAPLIKEGKVEGIVGSLTDITDRKKYEKQLKQSLERYDYVSKASRDAIYDWDITNNNIHWGEGLTSLFGHKSGEKKYPTKNWEKLVHSDDVEETKRDLDFTLKDTSMNKWTYEYRLKKAQGGYAHVVENGYIIRNDDGKAIRMIGALRDITESKRSEIQNEIQREIAHIFKEQEGLNPILRQVLTYLTNYGKFATAELWLKSAHDTHLNLVASHAKHKKGELFYTLSKDLTQFEKGSGLPGVVWQDQKIRLWNNIDSKTSFIRNKAAKNAGLKSAFGVPLFHNEEITGVLLLSSEKDGSENDQTLAFFEGLQGFLGSEIKRKQQEEEFKLLFESAPEILAVASPNGQFVKVNPTFTEVLGYSEEELTSQPFSNFIHPEDLKETKEEFSETITGKRHADNFINRYITKNGDIVWISWYSSDVFGEDEFVFSYGRDVTETVELEQLLQLTNRLAKVGSWEFDLSGSKNKEKVYWSDMTREIFEVPDDYDPNLSDDLEFFKPESRQVLQDAVQKAVDEGESYDHELQIITAEGTPKWVRCIGSAEFINGTCNRIFGSIQDITEKKSAEIEFEKAFKEKETILESIGDAFFAVDHDWTVTYWNKEAENVLMKPREEIIGKNLWVEYDDAIDLKFYSEYHKAVEEQTMVHFEEFYPGIDKWFEVSAYPSQNGLSVFFKDVTEKKSIQEQIEESNRKLKTAQQIAKLGYWKRDLDTNQLYWSDEVYNIWELDPEKAEPTLSYLYETIHPDDLDEFKNNLEALVDDKEYNIEHRIVLENGSVKWIHEKGNLIKEDGNPVSFEGTVQDITEKKRSEIELAKAYREKQNILESIEDGFFTINKNWIVTYWNRAAERMLHTAKQDIVDQNLWDVFEDAVDLPSYTNYHRAMHQKINVDFEDYYPPLDKWFDISAYPSPDGISVFFKDITERKKASEKLEQLNAELKQRADELAASNAELEQFAYVASHDLQEPLRMVTSFLTQLDKKYSDKLDEKANEYIHFAVDGAQRMRQIILDLLNYSRLNKDQAKRKKVDLNKLLDDARSLERSHITDTEAEITSEKLPTMKVNPGAIKQVFQNLLNNAIKYHRSGVPPKIKIRAEELDTHWKFSFSDNGIGINEEFKDTIFQIFQRLHTRDHYSGTGIGLAISKKIIERHEGEIWVESEEGKGSTFYFTLKK